VGDDQGETELESMSPVAYDVFQGASHHLGELA
jgi:hypothetical protein